MRLNKYIAEAGIASRRKADELIAAGNIKVNGLPVREMGREVEDGDVVEAFGRVIKPQGKKVYVMLNKPLDYVTTVSDDRQRPTVMELVADIPERIFPVGRLDYNTSGLLLLTSDGELANKLMHPKHQVPKTYRARVSGVLSDKRLTELRKGVDIGGYVTAPAKVRVIKQGERSAIVEIQIHEGKNRQVRKMFAAVGNKVVELERIGMGELHLGRLMVGHYRKLTAKEIEYLKNC